MPDNLWAVWTVRIEGTTRAEHDAARSFPFVQTFAGETTGLNSLQAYQAFMSFMLKIDGLDCSKFMHEWGQDGEKDASPEDELRRESQRYAYNRLGKLKGIIRDIVHDHCQGILEAHPHVSCQVNVTQVSAATTMEYMESWSPTTGSASGGATFEVRILPVLPHLDAPGDRWHGYIKSKRGAQFDQRCKDKKSLREAIMQTLVELDYEAMAAALDSKLKDFQRKDAEAADRKLSPREMRPGGALGSHPISAGWIRKGCIRLMKPSQSCACLGQLSTFSLEASGVTLESSTDLWTVPYHDGKGRLVKYEPHNKGFWIPDKGPFDSNQPHVWERQEIEKVTFTLHACTERVDDSIVKKPSWGEWFSATMPGQAKRQPTRIPQQEWPPENTAQPPGARTLRSPLDLMQELWPGRPARVDTEFNLMRQGSEFFGAAVCATSGYEVMPTSE